jgi:hypothetical protein
MRIGNLLFMNVRFYAGAAKPTGAGRFGARPRRP